MQPCTDLLFLLAPLFPSLELAKMEAKNLAISTYFIKCDYFKYISPPT